MKSQDRRPVSHLFLMGMEWSADENGKPQPSPPLPSPSPQRLSTDQEETWNTGSDSFPRWELQKHSERPFLCRPESRSIPGVIPSSHDRSSAHKSILGFESWPCLHRFLRSTPFNGRGWCLSSMSGR